MSLVLDGRYLLERQIGAAMGATFWEARDQSAMRPVIVKLFDAAIEPAERARFDRELTLVGALRSPHVLRMFSYGAAPDGRPFLVFEHSAGRTLGDALPGSFPAAAVERVVTQVASALWEAHGQGLVHRGISPDAIRVEAQPGEPIFAKVSDFGLLRGAGRAQQITATGLVMGSPEFMSPEQVRGEPLTAATDVYSLGVVAAWLLRAPGVTTPAHELARKVAHGDASCLVPDAVEFARTLARMLSESPADRPRMAQLAEMTRTARPTHAPVGHGVATERQMPLPDHTKPPAASNRTRTLWVAVGVAVLLAAGVAAFVVTAPKPEPEVPPEPATRRENPMGAALTEPAAPDLLGATGADEGAMADAAPVAPGCGSERPFIGRGMLYPDGDRFGSGWLTYVGRGYDGKKPAPMIVLLRQVFRTSSEFLEVSGFTDVANANGAIIVAPEDDDLEPWKDLSDVDRIEAIVESTRAQMCIDPDRIFLVGHGQGGAPAVSLACRDWVAGLATSAHATASTVTPCDDRTVPTIQLFPLHTSHFPFEGGEGCASGEKVAAKAWEAAWVKRNRCVGDPKTTYDRAGSSCREWSCGSPYASCHVNGGQTWPGARLREHPLHFMKHCDGPTSEFPAAERIWDFFSRIEPAATPE